MHNNYNINEYIPIIITFKQKKQYKKKPLRKVANNLGRFINPIYGD
jgi:hypothetical protein